MGVVAEEVETDLDEEVLFVEGAGDAACVSSPRTPAIAAALAAAATAIRRVIRRDACRPRARVPEWLVWLVMTQSHRRRLASVRALPVPLL